MVPLLSCKQTLNIQLAFQAWLVVRSLALVETSLIPLHYGESEKSETRGEQEEKGKWERGSREEREWEIRGRISAREMISEDNDLDD